MTIHRLYTRRGDQGQTSLAGGQRVSKSDLRVEAYGTVDELNSFLGLLVTYLSDHDAQCVEQVQHALFQVGASLATPYASVDDIPPIPSTLATTLEQEMDRMSLSYPSATASLSPAAIGLPQQPMSAALSAGGLSAES